VKGAPSFDGAHTVADTCAPTLILRCAQLWPMNHETLTLSRELIETFIRNYVFFSVLNTRTSRLTRILIHPRDTWDTERRLMRASRIQGFVCAV